MASLRCSLVRKGGGVATLTRPVFFLNQCRADNLIRALSSRFFGSILPICVVGLPVLWCFEKTRDLLLVSGRG